MNLLILIKAVVSKTGMSKNTRIFQIQMTLSWYSIYFETKICKYTKAVYKPFILVHLVNCKKAEGKDTLCANRK